MELGQASDMSRKPSRRPSGPQLVQIYARRQLRRPHYLAQLMERHGVERAEIIEATGVDKSLLSRWLDDEKPSTPGPDWANKLGEFFGKGGDAVDIFSDPDSDWLARRLQGKSEQEKKRIIELLDTTLKLANL